MSARARIVRNGVSGWPTCSGGPFTPGVLEFRAPDPDADSEHTAPVARPGGRAETLSFAFKDPFVRGGGPPATAGEPLCRRFADA
jgi:hypothetical protein